MDETADISIKNLAGVTIMQQSGTNQIDVNNLPVGLYFYELKAATFSASGNFLKINICASPLMVNCCGKAHPLLYPGSIIAVNHCVYEQLTQLNQFPFFGYTVAMQRVKFRHLRFHK